VKKNNPIISQVAKCIPVEYEQMMTSSHTFCYISCPSI